MWRSWRVRRGPRAGVRAAAVLLVVAAGGLAGAGQAPGAPGAPAAAPAAPPVPPPINVDAYKLCENPASYGNPFDPLSVLLAGYTNANKLKSALPLGHPTVAYAHGAGGPDEGLRASGGGTVGSDVYDCDLAKIQLDYQGRREFPPATATFLSFGFMPVTATVHLRQVGPDPITAVIYLNTSAVPLKSNGPYTVVATTRMSMSLTDVTVNGQPLDVGADCHTESPLTSPGNPIGYDGLVLTGGDNPGDPGPLYDFLSGGALAGTADVPPFTGCVSATGEDLDPLMTSMISGPGNDVKIVQGPLCDPTTTFQYCAPDGSPLYPPYWTVSNGGDFTSTAPLVLTSKLGRQVTTITCASTVAGSIPDTTGPPRGDLGSLAWTDISGCKDSTGATWTLTSLGTNNVGGRFYTADAGTSVLTLGNFGLHMVGPNGCTADVASVDFGVTFANDGSALELTPVLPLGSLQFTGKTCTTLFAGIQMSANYPLKPGLTITSP